MTNATGPYSENSTQLPRRRLVGLAVTSLAGIGGAIAFGVAAAQSTHHDETDHGHHQPDQSPMMMATGTPFGASAATPASTPVTGLPIFPIAAYDLRFEPREVRVPANTDVVVVFTNNGALQHDLVIPGLNINSGRIDPDASVEIPINAPAGAYEFFCSVPGHKIAGMSGFLIAE